MPSIQSSVIIRHSAEEMFPHIQAWQDSQLSQTEYCRLQQIKPHIFWYWLRRYRDQDHVAVTRSRFVPVQIEQTRHTDATVEIIYGDGTRIRFNGLVEVDILQRLLPKV